MCVCVCSFTDLVHCYHSVQSDSSSDSDSEEEKQRSRRDSDQNRPQGRSGRWRADRDSRKGIPLTPGVFIDCASETNISRRILCGSQKADDANVQLQLAWCLDKCAYTVEVTGLIIVLCTSFPSAQW